MKVRIIGRGSVGISVAKDLKASEDIAFVVGEDRVSRTKDTVIINGEVLNVPTLVAAPGMEKADLLILATKNFHLEAALPVIRCCVGDNTVILPILNGIDAEEYLSKEFGAEKVLYGFISGLSTHREGSVVESPKKGRITFGEKDDSQSERVKAISAYFTEQGLIHTVPASILHEKWWKFMLNTCYNTLTAILIADYAATWDNTWMTKAVRMVAKEVQAVGEKCGVTLTEHDVDTIIESTCASRDHGRSSMLEDVLNGRETENDYFCGAVSRLGRKHGIPTPYCDMLLILLEAKRHALKAN